MTPSESGDQDALKRLGALRQQIASHPAATALQELRAFELALTDVFGGNVQELIGLLEQAANDPALAMELVQNVRRPDVRDEFHGRLSQRLHNYLASALTLVDHSRRLLVGSSLEASAQFVDVKAGLLANREIWFMQDLRNFTLHRTLPWFGHTVHVIDNKLSPDTMESDVELSVAQLRAWNRWRPKSVQFLEEQGSALPLRPLVKRHAELVYSFNAWIHDRLSAEIDLEEVNQLVIEANAVLTGGDYEEAWRLSIPRWLRDEEDGPTRGSVLS